MLSDMESDRLERTISHREDKIGPAVCAFANDFANHKKPGYILLGVTDKGEIAGKEIDDAILQSLGDIRSNGNILPQPAMIVSPVYHFSSGDVVVIEVLPSDIPPVRHKGKCWIRVGPRKAIASPTEERILSEKRISIAKTYDQQPCKGARLEDMSVELFKLTYLPQSVDKETLTENNRDTKEQLASLRLYDTVHDCPTNAGILLLGINPLFFIKGAYIQYVKFDDANMSPENIAYEQVFSGALVTELRNFDEFIRKNIIQSRPIRNDSFQEEVIFNYPLWALRELVMNAIMHRDYESNAPIYIYEFSDRIEIINPGGLYGDARPENFPNASDYRNPELASAMKVLGYVNRFNFGVKNAQEALRKNKNPEAEFDLSLITKFYVKIRISKLWT